MTAATRLGACKNALRHYSLLLHSWGGTTVFMAPGYGKTHPKLMTFFRQISPAHHKWILGPVQELLAMYAALNDAKHNFSVRQFLILKLKLELRFVRWLCSTPSHQNTILATGNGAGGRGGRGRRGGGRLCPDDLLSLCRPFISGGLYCTLLSFLSVYSTTFVAC